MPASALASLLPADPSPAALLEALLAVSLTGVILFRPLYAGAAADAPLVDLAYEYLNPAAQQMLQLPARPPETFLTLFPSAATQEGVFAFYRDTFLAGQPGQHQFNYQHDGLDGYFQLAAQRQGALLVVSFTDTNDQPRTAAEQALRASQAREQAARQEAEQERRQLHTVLSQLPAQVATYRGPDHVYDFVNARYQAYFPQQAFVGRSVAQALPEAATNGVLALFDQVYRTGDAYHNPEREFWLTTHDHPQPQQLFLSFTLLPLRDAMGKASGLLDFSYDVTAQVLARQQAEQLNQELEARVQARTAQLSAQQRALGQILAQVPAAIATLAGPEHRYSFFNAPYQALAAQRTVLDQTVAEVFPEVVEQGFIDLLDQVYATGQPFIGTDTVIMLHDEATGQPEQRYVDFIYQPLVDDNQQTLGVLAFILDVTERVRTRKQVEMLQAAMLAATQRQAQARENVYQLFEQAPAAICLLRAPDHRIDYLNPAYQALFPGQQLHGKTLHQAQPQAREVLALVDGIYQTGTAQTQREVAVALPATAGQPATTRYVDFLYEAYREQDRIVGVALFGTDVTDRVAARQQRDAQQADQTRLFAQAPQAIVVLRGRSFIIEQANENAALIWGQPVAEVLGRPHFEAIPSSAGQGFEQLLTGVLDSGEAVVLHEVPIELARAHTGLPATGYYSILFKPLRDEHQQVSGVAVMWTEQTDQVLARQQVLALNRELAAINERLTATNKELHETNARLTRANTDLGTFVYMASHDLKAPISNIEGLVAALRETLPAAVQQDELIGQLLGLLDNTVQRFLGTIAQLTDLSRLQRAYEEPTELLALAPVVAGVLADLAPVIAEAGADVQVQVPAGLRVSFTPASMRSIIFNLLSNALQYRDPQRPAQVQLRAERQPQGLVLTVADNGLGLTDSQQQRLFQVFQRLHTHVAGLGVGLYLIKRLIENAGAHISVKSEVGVGSTFTVTFPA